MSSVNTRISFGAALAVNTQHRATPSNDADTIRTRPPAGQFFENHESLGRAVIKVIRASNHHCPVKCPAPGYKRPELTTLAKLEKFFQALVNGIFISIVLSLVAESHFVRH